MANIPGISGYTQPGTFARDRVVSRAVSIPGGLRLTCIMGEGLSSEVLVESAVGNGQDGSSSCSPTGSGDGRYFSITSAPLVSGRTEVYLNGSSLFGVEGTVDESTFDGKYDFRLDSETGCLELQGASIGDQDGRRYSASSLNVGNGYIQDGTCGDFDLISIIDSNAPPERWTIRCVSVIRDSSGSPVAGLSTFTASGSVSGQIKDSSGQPMLFHGTYSTGSNGAVSGNSTACADGFIVAESGGDFGLGFAVSVDGDVSSETTTQFSFSGDLITHGQAIVGDTFCLADGYSEYSAKITDIIYNSDDDETTVTVSTDSLPTDIPVAGVNWKIRATNLFIQDPSASYDDGNGAFSSKDINKVLLICSGDVAEKYKIIQVTSSRRVRLQKLSDSSTCFPEITAEADPVNGIAEENLTYALLETNGVLLFGIKEGSIPFEVGDKFYVDVKSKTLKKGDSLEVRYIAEATLNDPEFFTSAQELYKKHGDPSKSNTISLGAQMAFQNGAPGVFTVQCKPSVPRRIAVTIYEEKTSSGVGGFPACGGVAADCEVDDLSIIIPSPTSGLTTSRPDGDTNVNFFVKRNGAETQVFPNKVSFYNSQLESSVGQNNFISSSDYSYSYTVINTDTKITAQGSGATLTASTGYFTSLDVDFSSADVGRIIVLQSVENSSGVAFTSVEDVSNLVFGVLATPIVELVIIEIINDNTVAVVANNIAQDEVVANCQDINFFIKDEADTTNVSAKILLNKDLISSGTIKPGDGLRITYIDERDATFFDTNWFEALESLEAIDFQILVPLPTQTISSIFRAAVKHCEDMSTIANRKERMCYIGAQEGLTTAALIGTEEVAIEDIGVIEGIQGDDVEEVLSSNVEDLANYKLSDNYTSNRAVYFYPDRVVTSINGSNVFVHGFYMAAAAAGYTSAIQNVAIPLTFKELSGFTITRDRQFRRITLDQLGAVGATVVQPITGGGRILAGRTTSQSGFIEDEEISVMFIRDRVKNVLRTSLLPFIGTVEDANTQGLMTARVKTIMSSLVSQGLVTGYENVRVEKDKVDPRQWNVYLRFTPAYPINYVFIDIEVGV
jgi:hypothetical protein